jgi:Flp pilus assembly protein TadB
VVHWFLPTYVVTTAIFLEILLLQNLELIFNLYLRHRFEAELIKFIDEIILTMSTGRSFRDAFVSICQQNESYFTKKILEIHKSSQLNTIINIKNWQNEPKFLDLWHLFRAIEQNTHKQLEKLRAYRRQLYWEQNFRRKSAQATSQVKAQAFILSGLYIALLIYVLKTTGGNIVRWILISLMLYLTGLLSLYILGKRKPWKT